jgi:hypothetical protein
MAEDARALFVDGLRVTADHRIHLQDRLREELLDLRRSVGLGRIAWGLRVQAGESAGTVTLAPGVAFTPSGVRLAVDSLLSLEMPDGAGPFPVVLRASDSDREALLVDLGVVQRAAGLHEAAASCFRRVAAIEPAGSRLRAQAQVALPDTG